ncbi:MAG TPA: hypothetical protein ENK52_06545 [Saprospiraceae bacterium]|nr:hypothetical protein [Saprospiraceae bacterium]
MATRTKVTGFTRLLLVLIIAAPLAYIGASYYNGEDGIQNIKELVGMGDKTEESVASPNETDDSRAVINRLKREIKKKDLLIKKLNESIDQKDQEIENLKQQINNN